MLIIYKFSSLSLKHQSSKGKSRLPSATSSFRRKQILQVLGWHFDPTVWAVRRPGKFSEEQTSEIPAKSRNGELLPARERYRLQSIPPDQRMSECGTSVRSEPTGRWKSKRLRHVQAKSAGFPAEGGKHSESKPRRVGG